MGALQGERLLIVKLSSLGDLFHSLPAINSLKRSGALIDLVTTDVYRTLAQCFADIDNVIPFPRRGFFRRGAGFYRELRRNRYDRVVDFQGLLKSAAVTIAARAGERNGPVRSREGAHLFYHRSPDQIPGRPHAVDQALAVAEMLGAPAVPVEFPFRPPPYGIIENRPRVAILPRSRWKSKDWPAGHFAETARMLQEQAGATVFVVGGNDDIAAGREIAAAATGVRNLCGKTSLPELGGLLGEMDLLVSVDSGPMHMAAAAGTPVLAVFGPTDPRLVGPYGKQHRVVSARRTHCWPCRNRHCPQCRRAMAELQPEAVLRQALEMIGKQSAADTQPGVE